VRVEVRVTTLLHSLTGVIERDVFRQGEGILEVDGVKQKLHAGGRAVIPVGGVAQRKHGFGWP